MRGAEVARVTLENLGIGIDDAANGVFLRKTYHHSLHTNKYHDEVRKMLSGVTTKAEAEKVLNSIGQKLQTETFP